MSEAREAGRREILREISVTLKTCEKCGTTFAVGKTGSIGYMFWCTLLLTFIGGVVYYFLRHKERCPQCGSTDFTKSVKKIAI